MVVVSEKFEGKSLVARHRMVNELFAAEMRSSAMHGEELHARSLQHSIVLRSFSTDDRQRMRVHSQEIDKSCQHLDGDKFRILMSHFKPVVFSKNMMCS